ncbi:magnesium transporter [Aliivibrio sp. S2TY2]|uniref:magnesium transporter n=1 Tax=unclassified Aliivibrio TaxID=2645654 RepID=UPI002378ABB5|nr:MULTISPECIES: magnesium transporter [unclassified Aliivibrio]MDD9175188.1 magnesium transporter [Aliivibrio sp. S3TY1]MDD9192267.1 magnesium transporter [Aliivibrio sp. S2TY2]
MNEHQDLSFQLETLFNADDQQQQISLLGEFVENGLDTGSIARILESFPVDDRVQLWRHLPLEMHIEVLTEMRADARVAILEELSEAELNFTLAKLDNLSLIEWAESLPDEIFSLALQLISRDELDLYDDAKQYEDDEVGHWADRKIATLPFNVSVGRAKKLLKTNLFQSHQYMHLINRAHKFHGIVQYTDILTADDSVKINTLKLEDCLVLNVHQPLNESIEAVEHSAVPSVAIIDDDNVLIGQLDWQFAINTQREIYETRLMAGTGMDEGDDLFSPIIKSSKKRGVWLGINLLTAILASVTIGLFEDVITQVVALAVLMPIVASMGGIAGSQTLTLMVRAMALNQITPGNRFALLKNELGIGSINGLLWSLIIGGIAGAWFQSFALGATISLAIIVNIITAALFGVLIPITLDKFKLDPALAGSVILTTVTDVVGFFAFLGTASLVMM